jgi:hypothetical protein
MSGVPKRLPLFFPLRYEGRSESERARSAARGMAFAPQRHPPALRATPFLWKGVKP